MYQLTRYIKHEDFSKTALIHHQTPAASLADDIIVHDYYPPLMISLQIPNHIPKMVAIHYITTIS